jgi:hypothetical protein
MTAKVLIVDDDPYIREVMVLHLRREGGIGSPHLSRSGSVKWSLTEKGLRLPSTENSRASAERVRIAVYARQLPQLKFFIQSMDLDYRFTF